VDDLVPIVIAGGVRKSLGCGTGSRGVANDSDVFLAKTLGGGAKGSVVRRVVVRWRCVQGWSSYGVIELERLKNGACGGRRPISAACVGILWGRITLLCYMGLFLFPSGPQVAGTFG